MIDRPLMRDSRPHLKPLPALGRGVIDLSGQFLDNGQEDIMNHLPGPVTERLGCLGIGGDKCHIFHRLSGVVSLT